MFCKFCKLDIYLKGFDGLQESHSEVKEEDHSGMIYKLGIPGGIHFNYFKINSAVAGKIVIDNLHPFLQLSYTISGKNKYTTSNRVDAFASFKQQEYNYLFLPREKIHFEWEPSQTLEIFNLGISQEMMLHFLPEEHPIYSVLNKSIQKNIAVPMNTSNLTLLSASHKILHEMLHCPLYGRYKQLYMRGKTTELVAIQLEQFEHSTGMTKPSGFKKLKDEEIERMYRVREIILANIHNPCSLIDLAHQVGTNDAYLKKHFKEVFGSTVFGFLLSMKMKEARILLLEGKNVSEVAHLTGYKYVAHFTRAFKKHFGIIPNQLKQ